MQVGVLTRRTDVTMRPTPTRAYPAKISEQGLLFYVFTVFLLSWN